MTICTDATIAQDVPDITKLTIFLPTGHMIDIEITGKKGQGITLKSHGGTYDLAVYPVASGIVKLFPGEMKT